MKNCPLLISSQLCNFHILAIKITEASKKNEKVEVMETNCTPNVEGKVTTSPSSSTTEWGDTKPKPKRMKRESDKEEIAS